MAGEDALIKGYVDTHNAYYNAARAEIVQRILIREQVFIAYLTIVGGFFSFVVKYHADHPDIKDFGTNSLVLAPITALCICFALVLVQNHQGIGIIARYISYELNPNFVAQMKELAPESFALRLAVHLDGSEALKQEGRRAYAYRFYAQAIICTIPLLYSVFYFFQYFSIGAIFHRATAQYAILPIVDLITLIGIVYLHWKTRKYRVDYHDPQKMMALTVREN